jgi:hypothetical protein
MPTRAETRTRRSQCRGRRWSGDGTRFSLEVDRYEFPDEELGPTEDNPADYFDRGRFLFVTISCVTPEGRWQATAPEMTTTELEAFAEWLQVVSQGRPAEIGAGFTERDLEFSVDLSGRKLNVHLYWKFRPVWTTENHLTISFPLDELDFDAARSFLHAALVRFPHRPALDEP